jgi:hypothetical protein
MQHINTFYGTTSGILNTKPLILIDFIFQTRWK